MKRKWMITGIFICLFLLAVQHLPGMPAFARKYRLSCKTCHNPFPRLTEYGEEFAGNGFVLKDKKAPRYFVETGDSELSLIRDIPIAFKLEGFVNYNNANKDKVDFTSPYLLKILSGGSLARKISYYFYFFLSERGKVAGIEDAFIMLSDFFGTGIDFSLGQFQVSDPLFKRELRLTFEDYQIYRARPGTSRISLTYDRGIMLGYGLESGTDFTLEILNGNGIDESDIFRNFDDDKYKTFFGRISQTVSKTLRVGLAGYYGKESFSDTVNEVVMWGGDFTLTFNEKFQVNGQYLERRDDNPYFRPAGALTCITRGAFAEAIWTPGGNDTRLYGTLLWNWVDSNENVLDYHSISAHAGLLLRRNFRVVGEITWVLKSPFGDNSGRHARMGVGLITAF